MALILAEQSELWDRLILQAYAAMRQRIDLQYKLSHHDRAQVGEFIQRHLMYAGTEHDIYDDELGHWVVEGKRQVVQFALERLLASYQLAKVGWQTGARNDPICHRG